MVVYLQPVNRNVLNWIFFQGNVLIIVGFTINYFSFFCFIRWEVTEEEVLPPRVALPHLRLPRPLPLRLLRPPPRREGTWVVEEAAVIFTEEMGNTSLEVVVKEVIEVHKVILEIDQARVNLRKVLYLCKWIHYYSFNPLRTELFFKSDWEQQLSYIQSPRFLACN